MRIGVEINNLAVMLVRSSMISSESTTVLHAHGDSGIVLRVMNAMIFVPLSRKTIRQENRERKTVCDSSFGLETSSEDQE